LAFIKRELFQHGGVGFPVAFLELALDRFGAQARLGDVAVLGLHLGDARGLAPAARQLQLDLAGHEGLRDDVVKADLPFALVLGAAALQMSQSLLRLLVGVLGVGLLDDGALELGLGLLPALAGLHAGLLEHGQLAARFAELGFAFGQLGGGGEALCSLAGVLQLAVEEGLVAHHAGHLFVELGQALVDGLAATGDGGSAELVLAGVDPDRAAAAVVAVVGVGRDPLAAELDAASVLATRRMWASWRSSHLGAGPRTSGRPAGCPGRVRQGRLRHRRRCSAGSALSRPGPWPGLRAWRGPVPRPSGCRAARLRPPHAIFHR
jgi:hypothetical protein